MVEVVCVMCGWREGGIKKRKSNMQNKQKHKIPQEFSYLRLVNIFCISFYEFQSSLPFWQPPI